MKAYPFSHRHPTTGVTTSSEGMDLRDYFAGLAMQAYLMDEAILQDSDHSADWLRKTAVAAYEMADLMLKERNK